MLKKFLVIDLNIYISISLSELSDENIEGVDADFDVLVDSALLTLKKIKLINIKIEILFRVITFVFFSF